MKEISTADFMPIDGPMAQTLSIVNGFSCVFGSLGNLALITVISLHKQLHGASEILLMSLALADFVSCGVYLPLLLIRINTNEKLPTEMNQSRRAIGQAASVCGSLNLLMLTVDRLIFFYRPLRYNYWMRKKVVIMIIILIYGISLFVGLYAYFEMIKSQYPKVVLVGVPMLIFFALHYAIYRLAQTHRSQVANQQHSLQHNYNINSSAMVQARRNVRTVMLFGILYLLTWLPVTVFQLWRSVTNYHDPKSFQKHFYLLLTIQQISACIDPYLCCYRNNKVKAVFKKLLAIRRYLNGDVGGLGSSLGNTTSMSLSEGLDMGKSNRNIAEIGKAVVVSDSVENILGTKAVLEESNDHINTGDKILSGSLQRASPNEYESFESIYKIRRIGCNEGENTREQPVNMGTNMEKSSREQHPSNLSESLGNKISHTNNFDCNLDKNTSCVENLALDPSESLENINTNQVLEQMEDNSAHCNLDKNTNLSTDDIIEQSAMKEYQTVQNINKDQSHSETVENVDQIDSLTLDEVVLNLSINQGTA